MKAFDYNVVKQYKFADIMKPLFKLICLIFFRIRVVGKDNVPKDGGFIIASNHVSAPDPGFVYINLKRPIHFMGKKELYKNAFFNWIYVHLNGFPVNRGVADKRPIKYSIKVIEQGHVLGIFPEGTRSEDGSPQEAKTGVALIARESKADVVPVSIYSEDKIKPFAKITVRFGKPILYETLGFSNGIKSDELKFASKLVMDEIKKLWSQGHSKLIS